ncbi:hypothetical protein B0I35DRAFT_413011 [Stachybotrys elegans]|uniref:Uncharacterized protein n=1 Tax=Stachybotrys elegans TaxID=80388 RepID=A0A8K0SIQ0_9HYPO|nr:hypothetical protein B0I35DRAFT_413011 [Stachybotrys elegans]
MPRDSSNDSHHGRRAFTFVTLLLKIRLRRPWRGNAGSPINRDGIFKRESGYFKRLRKQEVLAAEGRGNLTECQDAHREFQILRNLGRFREEANPFPMELRCHILEMLDGTIAPLLTIHPRLQGIGPCIGNYVLSSRLYFYFYTLEKLKTIKLN